MSDTPKYCIICGAKLQPGAKFCARCGSETDEAKYSKSRAGVDFSTLEKITVGRADGNTIQVNRPYMSAHHATLTRTPNGYEVRDHNTLSGTYINGKPISGAVLAKEGDTIGVGSFDFLVKENYRLVQRPLEGRLIVEGARLTYRVRNPSGQPIEIIKNASILAKPRNLVAIMGPSGCGKTTLLNALMRNLKVSKTFKGPKGEKLKALEGETLINNVPLSRNYHAFMRIIGYVPQDDLVHPDLTVREALEYTHRLRLPSDYSKEEINQRIEKVLSDLRIDPQIWDSRIGSAEKRGISGGERKRVNIATELLSDPDIIFLDEPTSGLASTDAKVVVEALKDIAKRGKTVVFTIHQPSSRILELVDQLAVIAKTTRVDMDRERQKKIDRHHPGTVVYFGPPIGKRDPKTGALPECAARFFYEDIMREKGIKDDSPEWNKILEDPDSILDGMDSKPFRFWLYKYNYEELLKSKRVPDERKEGIKKKIPNTWATTLKRRFVVQPGLRGKETADDVAPARLRRPPNTFHQWLTLTRRFARIRIKDALYTLALILQAPLIASILVWVYHDTAVDAVNNMVHIPLFLLVTIAVWFGASNAAREIVVESAIFHRERMLGQSIGSYIGSKLIVLSILALFQCVVLLGFVHIYLGLMGDFLPMLGVLFISALGGVGMGFLLSAVVTSSEAANAMVPIILIPQLVLGGLMQPIGQMNPEVAIFSNLTLTRWGYEALLELEEVERQGKACKEQNCDGSVPFNHVCEQPLEGLDTCEKTVRVLQKERTGALIPAASDETTDADDDTDDGKQKKAKSKNWGLPTPEKGCMPSRTTRICQFKVPKNRLEEQKKSPLYGLMGEVRTMPIDLCVIVLFLFVFTFHFLIFWVLRSRDVGVERRF